MMTQHNLDTMALCCERFKESYERGEISYSYENSSDIDETEWYIDEFYHLYYCPFCGAFIKGHGSGNYDDKYPPAEGARIFKRRTDAK
jgi:hypothetical protein